MPETLIRPPSPITLSNKTDDGLLTTQEVADKLRVSVTTIYRMIQKGEILTARVGVQWRFKLSDVERVLAVTPNVQHTQQQKRKASNRQQSPR